jgi:TRAP-type C4-dicarboxylate transport system permease large subunit
VRLSFAERFRSLIEAGPIIGVFLVVVVGIYGGWADPTEAATIGAAATGLLAVRNGMRWQGFKDSILGTASSTAMIFLILLGADLLNTGLALTQMPVQLATWVQNSGLPPLLVLATIIAVYVLLGCVMDSLAMILLTIPIFYPMIIGLDFYGMTAEAKSIWFGILALMVVEIGLVHPPLGINLFIIQRIAKDVPYLETAKGVIPFLLSDLVRIVLLVTFPSISLWLLHLN